MQVSPLRFFYVLRKPDGLSKQESKDVEKYINMTFLQMEEDWNTDQIYFESNHGVKRCEATDFGEDAQSQAYYHTWVTDTYQFDLFCPDLKNQDLKLYNQRGAMRTKSVVFRIETCQDDSDIDGAGYCKSK